MPGPGTISPSGMTTLVPNKQGSPAVPSGIDCCGDLLVLIAELKANIGMGLLL